MPRCGREAALVQAGGNKTRAAERRGLRPSIFQDRLTRLIPEV